MRKICVSLFLVLFVSASAAQAGIVSYFLDRNNYNNNYYPQNAVNRGFYPRRYYGPNYVPQNYIPQYYAPQNFYYNQQPVIYRTRVNRKSQINNNEKKVSSNFTGLDRIEKQLLNQSFDGDTPQIRIERLEQKLFGAVQSGQLEERFFVLKSAAKNYKAFNPQMQNCYGEYNNPNYRPPIFTGTMGSNWRNTLWGNFRNQFAGVPTGFTPAMDPAYMDWFEAERAMAGNGQSNYYQTRKGYEYSDVNRGASTGVTILD